MVCSTVSFSYSSLKGAKYEESFSAMKEQPPLTKLKLCDVAGFTEVVPGLPKSHGLKSNSNVSRKRDHILDQKDSFRVKAKMLKNAS